MNVFSGKTVLITGAAGGIGQTMSRYFAERGGRIAALDKSERVQDVVATLTAAGFEAVAAVCDIGVVDQVKSAFDEAHLRLGNIDILVNNAGFSAASNLEATTAQSWKTDLHGNLNGAYHCTRLAIIDMQAASAGAIVNIGSVNGLGALGDPAYSAAKAGLISYTKSLAMEYGRFGIRANVICPGTVRTPIWVERLAQNPKIFKDLVKWYPLRRVADPIDIAKAAGFLASDDAAAITGVVLPVDCGLSAGNIVMARELTLAEF